MEKGPPFDMDMEEWELLPDGGLFNGKTAKGVDCSIRPDDPCKLLESVGGLTVTKADRKRSADHDPIKTNEAVLGGFPDEELVKEEIKEINVVPSPPAPVVVEKDDPVVKSDARRDEPGEPKFADITNDAEKTWYVASVGVGREDVKREQGEEKKRACSVQRGKGCWNGFGFSIWRWRWRLTGIGTLCSIGMAAATICIFIWGGHQRQRNLHRNQKLQLQIQPEEKVC